MKIILLFLVILTLNLCQGFILDVLKSFTTCRDSKELKPPVRGVEQSCLDDADSGMCRFYECFERRYPCDTCGFAKEYGQYVCQKFHEPAYYGRFDDAGKRWVNSTSRCLMATMKEMYQRPRVSCGMTKTIMIDQVSNCYLRNDVDVSFCDIAVANREALLGVFEAGNFVRSYRVLSEVVQLITNCAGTRTNPLGKRVRDFFARRSNRTTMFGGRIRDRITDAINGTLGDRVRDIVSESRGKIKERGEKIKERVQNITTRINDRITDRVDKVAERVDRIKDRGDKIRGRIGESAQQRNLTEEEITNSTETGNGFGDIVSNTLKRVGDRIKQFIPGMDDSAALGQQSGIIIDATGNGTNTSDNLIQDNNVNVSGVFLENDTGAAGATLLDFIRSLFG